MNAIDSIDALADLMTHARVGGCNERKAADLAMLELLRRQQARIAELEQQMKLAEVAAEEMSIALLGASEAISALERARSAP